jgi:hypothetical protein
MIEPAAKAGMPMTPLTETLSGPALAVLATFADWRQPRHNAVGLVRDPSKRARAMGK